MIYRIDWQHFLLHAIDHFTREELLHFQYLVNSSMIKTSHGQTNVRKMADFYPRTDIVVEFDETKDTKILQARMFDEYDMIVEDSPDLFYKVFLQMINGHIDLMIINDKEENPYTDVLCKYLKKKFDIEVIDLNELFTKGKVGPLHLDRKAIWNQSVDIRRRAGVSMIESLSTSKGGKIRLIESILTEKQKIQKLKELGIKVNKEDKKNLNQLLMEAWIDEDEDD